MSDTESKVTEGPVEVPSPKKRVKKKPSAFLVLRKMGGEYTLDGVTGYIEVASNGTLKGCRKKIVTEKIEGELLIVCVRQRLTTSLQQELVFA